MMVIMRQCDDSGNNDNDRGDDESNRDVNEVV